MSYKSVDAGRGLVWLSNAFALVMKNPAVLLVIALIVAVFQAIPLLNFAMVFIGPALFGGYLYAMREQDQDRQAEIGQLFAAFQLPGKIGPMLLLCVPGLVTFVVCLVLVFVFVGTALFGAALGSGSATSAGLMAGIGLGGLIAALLIFGLMLALYAVMFFAVPRVMFDDVEPFAAMSESVAACLANLGAILLLGIAFLFAGMVSFLVLAFIPVLGLVVWGLAFWAMAAAVTYVAYKDVFAVQDQNMLATPPPPPPPA